MEFARGVDLISGVIAQAPGGQSRNVRAWLESLGPVGGPVGGAVGWGVVAEPARSFEVALGQVVTSVSTEKPEDLTLSGTTVAKSPTSATGGAQPASAPAAIAGTTATDRPGGAAKAGNRPQDGLERGEAQLRAFVIQMMIEEMMPDDIVGLGGKSDYASGIWRSMLAEKLALQLSSSIELDLLGTIEVGQSMEVVGGNGVGSDAASKGSGV